MLNFENKIKNITDKDINRLVKKIISEQGGILSKILKTSGKSALKSGNIIGKTLVKSKRWVSPTGNNIVKYFETSQGSKYLRSDIGETKRWKIEHKNAWDSGLKNWYSKSIFVPETQEQIANAAQFLIEKNYKIALSKTKEGKNIFMIYDNKWRPATYMDAYPKYSSLNPNISKKLLIFDSINEPKIGYNIVEYDINPNGTIKSYHFGSPVSIIKNFQDIDDNTLKLFLSK